MNYIFAGLIIAVIVFIFFISKKRVNDDDDFYTGQKGTLNENIVDSGNSSPNRRKSVNMSLATGHGAHFHLKKDLGKNYS